MMAVQPPHTCARTHAHMLPGALSNGCGERVAKVFVVDILDILSSLDTHLNLLCRTALARSLLISR